MDEALRRKAEETLGYVFSNPDLLEESLTHASIADDRLDSNERMEFLGDSVLDLVVCEDLFRQYPNYFEGEMTRIKSVIVSRKTCAEIARELKLGECLITGKGITRAREMPASLIANMYEAVVAAIYLDGGFAPAADFVRRTMSPKIKGVADNLDAHNFKAVLQQACQRILGSTPQYELLDEKGPDHSKCFEVCVSVDGRRFEGAWGPNKKIAEQKAALMALEELG
ncbi:MAG: ribonuclease III, partial [Planctomycetota bacterium]